jgi:purine-binding chemotaxis protein CheW
MRISRDGSVTVWKAWVYGIAGRILSCFATRSAARLNSNLSAQRAPVSPGMSTVIFWLGEERYAIDLKDLAEVLPCTDCTPVPGTPARFLGVVNVHGQLRSVLDLSVVLGVPRRDGNGSGFVLMLSHRCQGIGLRVDGVEDLREIRLEGMPPANQGKFVEQFKAPGIDKGIPLVGGRRIPYLRDISSCASVCREPRTDSGQRPERK